MDAGETLRNARRDAGWSQAELASAVGMSTSLLCRYERGRCVPSVDQLERLLAPLGLELTVTPRHSAKDLTRGLQRLLDVYPELPPRGADDYGAHDGDTLERLTDEEYRTRVRENGERYARWRAEQDHAPRPAS